MSNSPVILPGATIGILGDGQLGRMLALTARRMGYRTHTLGLEANAPAAQVADAATIAPYDDLAAVRRWAATVAVATFEFENVPAATATAAAEATLVRPAGDVLHITQHRLREKMWLQQHGLPVAPFQLAQSEAELMRALDTIGYPAVLKTTGFGYDGKGQRKIMLPDEAAPAWAALGGQAAILEAWLPFECEVSVVAARGVDGTFAAFPLIENQHHQHILDVSLAPARVSAQVTDDALGLARAVLEALQVVGVLCVEFFLLPNDRLVINELAPRPHNSGHLTIEAAVTSQFEQQLRAICGLPLGATTLVRPAAMANVLGEAWSHGEPQWSNALMYPDIKLHLYGKQQARTGRKMGHLTALAATPEEAAVRVRAARASLMREA